MRRGMQPGTELRSQDAHPRAVDLWVMMNTNSREVTETLKEKPQFVSEPGASAKWMVESGSFLKGFRSS